MRRRHAFTLIELVLVLVTLGILAGVAAPRYVDSVSYYSVEAAAKRVAADLRYARNLAVESAVALQVDFDAANDRYVMESVQDIDSGEASYTVVLAEEGYGVDLQQADFGGQPLVILSHRGDPHSTGTVTLQSGAATRTVTVDAVGNVTIGP